MATDEVKVQSARQRAIVQGVELELDASATVFGGLTPEGEIAVRDDHEHGFSSALEVPQ